MSANAAMPARDITRADGKHDEQRILCSDNSHGRHPHDLKVIARQMCGFPKVAVKVPMESAPRHYHKHWVSPQQLDVLEFMAKARDDEVIIAAVTTHTKALHDEEKREAQMQKPHETKAEGDWEMVEAIGDWEMVDGDAAKARADDGWVKLRKQHDV